MTDFSRHRLCCWRTFDLHRALVQQYGALFSFQPRKPPDYYDQFSDPRWIGQKPRTEILI